MWSGNQSWSMFSLVLLSNGYLGPVPFNPMQLNPEPLDFLNGNLGGVTANGPTAVQQDQPGLVLGANGVYLVAGIYVVYFQTNVTLTDLVTGQSVNCPTVSWQVTLVVQTSPSGAVTWAGGASLISVSGQQGIP
jgi:hypothetical protein